MPDSSRVDPVPPAEPPAPSNRAARRGRPKPDAVTARSGGVAGRARSAQGRRVIPVRRTG